MLQEARKDVKREDDSGSVSIGDIVLLDESDRWMIVILHTINDSIMSTIKVKTVNKIYLSSRQFDI